MQSMKAKSFVLYSDYGYQIELLSMSQKGRLLDAIFGYVRTEEYPDIEDDVLVNAVFRGIKSNLDRDRAEYEKRCAANAENGRKGGRPRKTGHADGHEPTENIFLPKTEGFSEKPKKAYNDNGNGNGNGNDNKNDNDIVIGNGIGNGNGNDNDAQNPSAPPVSDPNSHTEKNIGFDGRDCPLSVGERDELLRKGLDRDYIAEREERALRYARDRGDGSSVSDILLRWWREDKGGQQRKKARGNTEEDHSYDIDEFFAAAAMRAMEAMEEIREE